MKGGAGLAAVLVFKHRANYTRATKVITSRTYFLYYLNNNEHPAFFDGFLASDLICIFADSRKSSLVHFEEDPEVHCWQLSDQPEARLL